MDVAILLTAFFLVGLAYFGAYRRNVRIWLPSIIAGLLLVPAAAFTQHWSGTCAGSTESVGIRGCSVLAALGFIFDPRVWITNLILMPLSVGAFALAFIRRTK